MTYCDSSFLAALYRPTDILHRKACQQAAKFNEAVPYTLLNELELVNSLRRCLGDCSLDQASHDAIIREIERDEADGLLERMALNQVKLYEKARELSRKHTPALACRSLDILHVAAASVLGAKAFASFDLRQRKLAKTVGLSVQPTSFS